VALREFCDAAGVTWKVWHVTPEHMHPRTAAKDYLGDLQEGWLTFECAGERRRLADVPHAWHELSDSALAALSRSASPVKQRAPEQTYRDYSAMLGRAPERDTAPEPAPKRSVATAQSDTPSRRRIFSDPAGHVVIVGVEPDSVSGGMNLHFRRDDKRGFTLAGCPDNWDQCSKEDLIKMYIEACYNVPPPPASRAAVAPARPAFDRTAPVSFSESEAGQDDGSDTGYRRRRSDLG